MGRRVKTVASLQSVGAVARILQQILYENQKPWYLTGVGSSSEFDGASESGGESEDLLKGLTSKWRGVG
jgi:hypothetical protein